MSLLQNGPYYRQDAEYAEILLMENSALSAPLR